MYYTYDGKEGESVNKKGYLLSELIVSFSLSFIILIVIFNTTITLNKKLSELYIDNKATSNQMIFNRKIGRDFSTNTVTAMTYTEGTKTCAITYNNSNTKNLIVTNTYIEYNNEQIDIPENMKVDNNNIICEIDNGIATLMVPIKYSMIKKNYGIELYDITG